MNLAVLNKNLMIVPIMVSYDRIFENLNLATEMVSGQNRRLRFHEAISKIYNLKPNEGGSYFVKYLEPINVKQYLQERGVETLEPDQVQSEAYHLSEELLKRQ